MRDFEKILKDKLDNFEMPYDENTWEAMQTKLDAKKAPITAVKWSYIVAGIISLVSAVSIINYKATSENNAEQIAKVEKQQQENNSAVNKEVSKTESDSKTNVQSKEEIVEKKDTYEIVKVKTNSNSEKLESNTNSDKKEEKESNTANTIVNQESTSENSENKQDNTTQLIINNDTHNDIYAFKVGTLVSSNICKGEKAIISNNYEDDTKVKFTLNGQKITLNSNETVKLDLTKTSSINFLDEHENIIGSEQIVVHELPNADFTLNNNLIEEGVSVVQVNAPELDNRTWRLDNKNIIIFKDQYIPVFEKDWHTITSKVRNTFGCEAEVSKTFFQDKEYNLLAPTAFSPTSSILKNRYFLPFALKDRKTPFKLIILSMQDGGVVFESSDPFLAWNGIDSRTGSLVDFNTPFVWQVNLEKPLPNEKNIYKGTVQIVKTP